MKHGRYVVETGKNHTVVYEGDNYQKAADRANFWDERQDTWLIDTKNEPHYWLNEIATEVEERMISVANRLDEAISQAQSALYRVSLHLSYEHRPTLLPRSRH